MSLSSQTPLPLNFPQTFLPDRRLLGQLLAFAARNGSSDKEAIGGQFTEAAFHRLLVERHGNKSYLKGLSTLVPRMYTERACFGEAGILAAAPGDDGKPLLRRARAPLEKGLFPAYALLLFLLWDSRYSTDKQLAFDELARDTRLLALLGWDATQATEWLDWMASRGFVQLDRYTGSVVLLRLAETPKVVAGLYSELV